MSVGANRSSNAAPDRRALPEAKSLFGFLAFLTSKVCSQAAIAMA